MSGPHRLTIAEKRQALSTYAASLPSQQVHHLHRIAGAFSETAECQALPNSDIATPVFVQDFLARLQVFHATATGNLSKEHFEHAFMGACAADGKTVSKPTGRTYPGEDVLINGVTYSCKTEASKGINPDRIVISKVFEKEGIKAMKTQAEWASVGLAVAEHLSHYDRIVMLRAFNRVGGDPSRVRYQFVEIPKALIAQATELEPDDFVQTKRGKGYSVSAAVTVDDEPAFTFQLDRNDEKITIKHLRVALCVVHAEWTLKASLEQPTQSSAAHQLLLPS